MLIYAPLHSAGSPAPPLWAFCHYLSRLERLLFRPAGHLQLHFPACQLSTRSPSAARTRGGFDKSRWGCTLDLLALTLVETLANLGTRAQPLASAFETMRRAAVDWCCSSNMHQQAGGGKICREVPRRGGTNGDLFPAISTCPSWRRAGIQLRGLPRGLWLLRYCRFMSVRSQTQRWCT